MKQKPFFARPRNLCVLIVFAACLLGLAAGVVRNCVLYAEDGLSQAVFSHRMWFSLLCVVMMSVIFLAELLFRVRFPLFLELFAVVFAFCSVALSTVYGFYERIPPWDTIMHFASGPLFSSVGLCLAWLLFRDKLQGAGRAVSYALFALLFALAVGYLWEVYEYAYDSLTGKSLQGWELGLIEDLGNGQYLVDDRRGSGLIDTMTDLIVNLAGSALFLIPVFAVSLKRPAVLDGFAATVYPRRARRQPRQAAAQTDEQTDEQTDPEKNAPQKKGQADPERETTPSENEQTAAQTDERP